MQIWLKFLQKIASKCKMGRRGYLAVYLTITEATQTCILNIIKGRLANDLSCGRYYRELSHDRTGYFGTLSRMEATQSFQNSLDYFEKGLYPLPSACMVPSISSSMTPLAVLLRSKNVAPVRLPIPNNQCMLPKFTMQPISPK